MLRAVTTGGTGQDNLACQRNIFQMCSISLCRAIKVAKEFTGKVNFAVSDKDDYAGELQALGLEGGAEVVVGLYDSKGKYAMTDKFS